MKKGLILSSLILMGMFMGCSGEKKQDTASTPAEKEVKTQVLKVAFNQSENHPQYKALEEFSKELETQTEHIS